MDEKKFRTYLSEFNAANYDALVQYYAGDVAVSFNNGPVLRGRDAVIAFYRPIHAAVKETLEIKFLVMDSQHVAVEFATEFSAFEDLDKFIRGPLKAGDVLRITSFVHYDIGPDGRFTAIRIGSFGGGGQSPASRREPPGWLRKCRIVAAQTSFKVKTSRFTRDKAAAPLLGNQKPHRRPLIFWSLRSRYKLELREPKAY
jgi:hypothetical protein